MLVGNADADRRDRRAVRGAVRPATRHRRAPRPSRGDATAADRRPAGTRRRDQRRPRPGRQPGRRPDPARLPRPDPGHPAHQRLPDRDADGALRPFWSFKLDPRRVPRLPKPVPAHEIWVYSPRVEGVHLRFGDIARGGLRWSDRPEDFRTEILGLVKAQEVKNAVIVPVGAKGGFVVKQPPQPTGDPGGRPRGQRGRGRALLPDVHPGPARPDRQPGRRPDRRAAATWCVTTTTTRTWSSRPTRAPRPSPTSPTRVAIENGFWLGDAFASGGSAGYDHKAMGITARGAWESVKHHFRELGVDTQTAGLHRRRRRRHERRRVRQRRCCCPRTSG